MNKLFGVGIAEIIEESRKRLSKGDVQRIYLGEVDFDMKGITPKNVRFWEELWITTLDFAFIQRRKGLFMNDLWTVCPECGYIHQNLHTDVCFPCLAEEVI